MIRFEIVPEPDEFDEKARKPGNAWITRNPGNKKFPDKWKPFRQYLRQGFKDLCGYCVMFIQHGAGEVDHYVSCNDDSSLTYEWSNYRFCSGKMNKAKNNKNFKNCPVLDPYEIQNCWFEIILPSLQLIITDQCPSEYRVRAENTLKYMHLQDDEQMIKQRQSWYELYLENELNLEGLRKRAPLIARAVDRGLSESNTSNS